MPRVFHATLMKPLAALATPGVYLFDKYNQYKRQHQEQSRRKVTEKELAQLNHKIDKLLAKLDEHEPEMATTQEDECVVCISAKASMQTYPCGHQVVCRKCFVKTIQMAVSQRLLPLRCVICRTKILRLKQQSGNTGSSRSFILSHSHSHTSQLTSYSSSTSSYYSATSSLNSSNSTSGSSSTNHNQQQRHCQPQRPQLQQQPQQRSDSSMRPLLVNNAGCATVATPKCNPRIKVITMTSLPLDGGATRVVFQSSDQPLPTSMASYNRRKVQDSSMIIPEMMCLNNGKKEKGGNRKFHKLPTLPKVTLRSSKSKKE